MVATQKCSSIRLVLHISRLPERRGEQGVGDARSHAPAPAERTSLERLLTREERSLLLAAQTTRILEAGAATDLKLNPLVEHVSWRRSSATASSTST